MTYYIITRGRTSLAQQMTWANLPDYIRDRTTILCAPGEREWFEQNITNQVYSVPVKDYSQKVQTTLELIAALPSGKGVIMDDDLWWDKRDPNKWERMIKVQHANELLPMFEKLEELMADTALCSIHPRMMGNLAPRGFKENGRICCLQAVNINHFPDKKVPRVDYDPILADVHLNLYLLSRGYTNRLLTKFVMNWAASQAEGGCDYRTMEMQQVATARIAEMYPGYAKQVWRKAKQENWLGDDGRWDLRIQWKKLFKDAPNA